MVLQEAESNKQAKEAMRRNNRKRVKRSQKETQDQMLNAANSGQIKGFRNMIPCLCRRAEREKTGEEVINSSFGTDKNKVSSLLIIWAVLLLMLLLEKQALMDCAVLWTH